MKKSNEEKENAKEHLLKMLEPWDTVETTLRHCARSGMSRSISPVIFRGGRTMDLSYWACRLLGYSFDEKHGGVKMGGCGMDMGFALVYDISRALFPGGFGDKGKLPDGRKVRPVSKKQADRLVSMGKAEFYGRNGDKSGWDNDGGYALKQRWV